MGWERHSKPASSVEKAQFEQIFYENEQSQEDDFMDYPLVVRTLRYYYCGRQKGALLPILNISVTKSQQERQFQAAVVLAVSNFSGRFFITWKRFWMDLEDVRL